VEGDNKTKKNEDENGKKLKMKKGGKVDDGKEERR
jgi:hypothetical protein